MKTRRRTPRALLALVAVAFLHAALTWPLRDLLVLYLGGAVLAFVGEATVVRLGLLRHHVGPRLAGVPVVVVLAWPSTVYVALRFAALVVPPGLVPVAAALLATAADVVFDPRGVEEGLWSYPDAWVSRPRFRGVPWWNVVGWLVVVYVTATLSTTF